jgi:hypothetical protein
MKIYLAGPMSGIPYFNFPEFGRVAALLRSEGWEVVSPKELDEQDSREAAGKPLSGDAKDASHSWATYLARDVKILVDGCVQGIVFLPGWEGSRGSRFEASVGLLIKGMRFYEWVADVALEIDAGAVASVLMVEALRYQEVEHPLLDVIESFGGEEVSSVQ